MAEGSDSDGLRASLWLQPKAGPLQDALQQTIAGLSPLFDDAPKFQPHVTITSKIRVETQRDVDRVLDGASAAAKSVSFLDVILDAVSFGSAYFRKVVLEVKRKAELVSLATICRERYVLWPEYKSNIRNFEALSNQEQEVLQNDISVEAYDWARDEFKPHLSLVYSDLYPVTEDIRATVEQRLKDVFGATYATRGIGWTGGRISLVLCEGPVEEWRELGYRDL